MTPETEAAAAVLAYSTSLSLVDARVAVLAAGGAAGVAWLLRPHAPSVRPSAPAPAGGGAPDGGRGGRTAPRAEKVGGRGEPSPKGWLVPGLVPSGPVPRRRLRAGLPPWRWERRGYVTTILGAGGVGKSYVLLDLALAALGLGPWLGRAVRRVPAVLYVDTELDAEECLRRAHPLARGRGLPRPPGGLRYLHLQPSLASEEGQAAVAGAARRVHAGLILVDSLTIGAFDVAASDQNGWNRVYTFLETLGAPVVAIDHLDKAGRGAFGSFMKQAKVRSCLQLSRVGNGIRVEHIKSNFGPKQEPFVVRASFGEGPGAATTFSVPADGQRESGPSAPSGVRTRADSIPLPLPLPVRAAPALPLPVREPAPQAGQGRALRVLSPLLEEGGWVPPAALVKALVAGGVCQRTAGYRLLARLATEGVLERRPDDGLPALAYRLPATGPVASGGAA